MTEQAATPTGGAEGGSLPSVNPPTTHDRIKALLSTEQHASAASEQASEPVDEVATEQVETATEEQAPTPEAVETEAEPELTAQQLSTLAELSEATGLELEKLMDLDVPTKIDGKEGKARLRDLIKSYQLEGHLNQKLMTFADEKKAFETEAQRKATEIRERVQSLQNAHTLAERLLHAEYASIDWGALKAQDPLTYNAKVVEFQERQKGIAALADMLGQENQRLQQEAAKQQQAYFQEQTRLLESKVPEWNTQAAREKALSEMAPVFEEAYGITKQELGDVVDHRQLLIARDAYQWQKLQKQKPAVLNKVKAAPKLVRPGTTRTAADSQAARLAQQRSQVRKTGSTKDTAALLKSLGLAKVN